MVAAPATAFAEPLAATDLAAVCDPTVAAIMAQAHIPGAVVVVVEDGRIAFSRGYGFADLAAHRPTSPRDTVFRVASLSKAITAAAVLQLVDRGQLDLAVDVNRYLKTFQVKKTFLRPITLADLLTHTAGFDEQYIGTAARTASEQVALGAYLKSHLPPRIMPPGRIISYSNHGFALAGYIVEQVSGTPYEDYVSAHIFQPLAMSHSGFRADARLRPALAVGYQYEGAAFRPVPNDFLNDLPAAGLLTTGEDMARFMIVQLTGGSYGGRRVLSPAATSSMFKRQFAENPLLPGRTYGYAEDFESHRQVLMQEGDLRGFASGLYFVPAARAGLFVAANSASPALREGLLQALQKHWLKNQPRVPDAHHLLRPFTVLKEAAGRYRLARYPHTTIDKLAVLLGFAPEIQVVASGDHGLEVDLAGGRVIPGVEVEPGFFQRRGQVDPTSGKGFALHRNRRGEYDLAFLGIHAYERLRWYEAVRIQLGCLAVLLLIFLAACVAIPLRWRRRDGVSRMGRIFEGLAFSMSFLNLVFIVGLSALLARTEAYEFTYGIPPAIRLLLLLPPLTSLLAVAVAIVGLLAWRSHEDQRGLPFGFTVSLAGLFFIPFLRYWNLLG